MIKPYLKDRLHENLIGTHIAMSDSIVSEMYGRMGYDYIWIDTEHSGMSFTELRNHITAIHAGGTPVVIRSQMNDYNHTKKIMEIGPDAILFPMVNTTEEANAVMRYCMYPPDGNRGFGPLRAVNYGLEDMDGYIYEANAKTCRFVQIESETAVKSLKEMVKNPYIDGFFFGPCDLSGSIGELNKVFGDNTLSLMREAVAILGEYGKPIGISTGSVDPEELAFWHSMGINMITAGTDYDFILKGVGENRRNMRRIMSDE